MLILKVRCAYVNPNDWCTDNVPHIDLLVVTEDGSYPTRTNTKPLGHGHGSMVWFTQSSMILSAQLPTDTMAEAKTKEREWQKQYPNQPASFSTKVDVNKHLEEGVFPFNGKPVA